MTGQSQGSLGGPYQHGGNRPRRHAAFTLYELLITVSIVSILATLSVPSFRLVRDQNMVTQINELLADIYLARSEAIKTGIQTLVCKSANGQSCSMDTNWHEGWLVFIDSNGNHRRDPGERILRVRQSLASYNRLRFSAFGPGIGRYLSYKPSGSTKQNGTFTLCDRSQLTPARAVIIIQTGRARVSRTKSDGSALNCS